MFFYWQNTLVHRLLLFLCPALLISPSIVWIFLDKRVWLWDQSWYGQISVELFYALLDSPSRWITDMMNAFSTKTPAIAWIGQFFVPLGSLLGSIDTALLLSILTSQFLTLILIFKSVLVLTEGRLELALISSLTIASAPLFVGLSHQYFVEPLQTLVVAWFILTMSFAPRWNRGLVISNLLGATSLGMLAKITSPLYCLGPGLISLAYIFYPQWSIHHSSSSLKPTNLKEYSVLGLATVIGLSSVSWYTKNLSQVIQFALNASGGSSAELYGKKDVFLNKLLYWLTATQKSFFLPGVAVVLGIVVLFAILRYVLKSRAKLSHFSGCALAAILHVVLMLALFSVNINEETRYLLPLLPHIAILIAWSLIQINRKIVVGFIGMILVVQLAAVHAQALGLIGLNSSVSQWLYTVDRDRNPADDLRQVVRETCTRANRGRYNIIGVERPWLNANSAAYFSAKLREPQQLRCYYTSLGYAEPDSSKAWQRLTSLKPTYFITLRRDRQQLLSDPLNQALNQVSLPVLEKIQSNRDFQLKSSIDRSGILLYRNLKEFP